MSMMGWSGMVATSLPQEFRKAVDKRAETLMEEYRKKAENMDRSLGRRGKAESGEG